MDTDLRASLVAAAFAAVLSALVGIVAGVGVFALLLRAVLGGALFGALVYGCVFFARRSLPGLSLEAERLGAEPLEEEDVRGRTVDIVLPGEGPEGAEPGEVSFREDARREDTILETLPAAPPESAATAAFAPPPRASAVESLHSADEEGAAEDLASLIGPAEGPGEPAVAVPAAEAPGLSSFDDLDVLPDLDGFSDSFAPAEFRGAAEESSVAARAPSSRGAPASAGAFRNESLDPATLAQAVRTILKRDQKG